MYQVSDYFKTANAFIEGNKSLRYPQRRAHKRLKEEFLRNPMTPKVIVLPTGTGKTGVIGLAPYDISNGRVLVITPSLVIREGISDDFDTRTIFNFWTKRNVILSEDKLPQVFRYAGYGSPADKKRVLKLLNEAHIVIANIHKVYNQKSSKPLVSILDPDFFDMIIIDEAHHSAADSWIRTLEYFNASKIVKLTATPYRADSKELEGEIAYNYDLASAVQDNLVKNLVVEDYTTQRLEFLVNGQPVDKDTALDLMDKNWVTRSVAYSKECSKTIVEMSIARLKEKRKNGNCHHQIIAVACSIEHANEIKKLYEEQGLSAECVSSDNPEKAEKAIIEYKKGQIDVIVNVNMLGEGFDHANISIAAIFRPFRTLAPYAQFIGRSLRRLQDENAIDEIDNVAHVIYHKELDLDDLWAYYVGEKVKAERRKELELEYDREGQGYKNSDIGEVTTDGSIIKTTKTFLEDGIASKYSDAIGKAINRREIEVKKTVEKMRQAGISDKDIEAFEKAKYRELDGEINEKRNKLREELIREELHLYHKEDVINQVDALFQEVNLEPGGNELPSNTGNPFLKSASTNKAYVIKYINLNLKQKLKRSVEEWETYDFEEARKLIPQLIENIRVKMEGKE